MGKKYVVRLSEQEREQLQTLVKKGTVKAYRVRHANILLKADANGPGWTDPFLWDDPLLSKLAEIRSSTP